MSGNPAPPPSVTTTSLPDAVVGNAYNQTLQASGGDGTYTWAVTSGRLPLGLALNAATGEISGTPTTGGTANCTVSVTSNGLSVEKPLSLTITQPPAPDVVTASLPNGEVGVPYAQTLQATGGDGAYVWAITVGRLPAGLSLDGAGGLISGAPISGGTEAFTVQVSSAGQKGSRALTLGVTLSNPLPSVTTESLPDAVVGTAYHQTLQASGGDGTYTWAATSGNLPAGLALNAATGEISGTPTAGGTNNFTVQVTSAGETNTKQLSMQVVPQANGHEPHGFSLLTQRSFDAMVEDEWSVSNNAVNFEIVSVSDPTAPCSPPCVGQIKFPQGWQGGSAPAWTARSFGPVGHPGHLYISMWHRVSPNWQNHPSSVNKILFVTDGSEGGSLDPMYLNYKGSTEVPPRFEYEMRKRGATGSEIYRPNVATVEVIPGEWHHVELLLVMNTAPGSRDGSANLWVDGLLTTRSIGILWSTGNRTWDSVNWQPVWGGNLGTVTNEMFQQVDDIFVSGQV